MFRSVDLLFAYLIINTLLSVQLFVHTAEGELLSSVRSAKICILYQQFLLLQCAYCVVPWRQWFCNVASGDADGSSH